jgi:hypothetical protein
MLAENDLSPRLDLRGEVGKDIGAVGLGGPTKTPLEALVGFRFSVPLQNRAAKGRAAEARAEIDALTQRSRFLRDQIAVEVEGIVIAVGATERLATIAAEEQSLAERLAVAERRRFELGSGDFFLVNRRAGSPDRRTGPHRLRPRGTGGGNRRPWGIGSGGVRLQPPGGVGRNRRKIRQLYAGTMPFPGIDLEIERWMRLIAQP